MKAENSITPEGAIDFIILGSGKTYIDLRRTTLQLTVKIVQVNEEGEDKKLPAST